MSAATLYKPTLYPSHRCTAAPLHRCTAAPLQVMCGKDDEEVYYTPITLGLFDDMGWYAV